MDNFATDWMIMEATTDQDADSPELHRYYGSKEDVRQLLDVLQRLVDAGNTVLVIEHNLDVIKTADRLIDLGPEGGSRGGAIVATGTPEQVAKVPESHTGRFLREILNV